LNGGGDIGQSACGGVAPRRGRDHNYKSVRDLVTERVRKNQGRISTKRLQPAAHAVV
jgi:hypothetical protein